MEDKLFSCLQSCYEACISPFPQNLSYFLGCRTIKKAVVAGSPYSRPSHSQLTQECVSSKQLPWWMQGLDRNWSCFGESREILSSPQRPHKMFTAVLSAKGFSNSLSPNLSICELAIFSHQTGQKADLKNVHPLPPAHSHASLYAEYY